MTKIKTREKDIDKISGKRKTEAKCYENLAFSFQYLTTAKKHSFDYFQKDVRKSHDNYKELYKKLQEISSVRWVSFLGRPKENGVEYIPVSNLQVRTNLPVDEKLTKDEKVISIRYGRQDYRIIGKQRSGCSIFYILAFDFDFSAYPHG